MTDQTRGQRPAVAPAETPDDAALPGAAIAPARLARAGGVGLGVAMALANVLGYGFIVVISRALGPDPFGAFSAVNNLGLVLAIPAGALQVVIARHQAHRDGTTGVALAMGIGFVGIAVGALCSPVGAWVFHLDSPWPVILVSANLLPMALTGALQGVLLGRGRLWALASLYLLTGAARVVAAVIALGLGLSLSGVFAALLVGSWVVALLAAVMCRTELAARTRGREGHLWGEVWRSNRTLAALITLSSIDVVLARHFLSSSDAGLYALASLFAKVIFWGTQFVALALVPLAAGAGARRRVLKASGLVAGCGFAAAGVVYVLRSFMVEVTGGRAYAQAQDLFVMFTVLGTVWAMAQVLLFADMARDRGRLGLLTWVICALQVGVVVGWRHGDAGEIASSAIAAAAAVVLIGLLQIVRWPRPRALK